MTGKLIEDHIEQATLGWLERTYVQLSLFASHNPTLGRAHLRLETPPISATNATAVNTRPNYTFVPGTHEVSGLTQS